MKKDIQIDISGTKYVIGLKQTLINLSLDNCSLIVVATDCDSSFKQRIFSRCKGKNVEVKQYCSKEELGALCKIDVPCGVMSVLKS